MKIVSFIILVLAALPVQAIEIHHGRENVVVRPFGIDSRQPPDPSHVVQLPSATFSISANQVCGYSSWTTLQLDLPKKLLSKQYWSKIHQDLVNKAKKTVLDMSYALPGVLVCNISPTFCHVFNQAEMMASFEGELSLETCKILDGVANQKGLMHESLWQCQQKALKEGGLTASEARERCLRGNTPSDQANNIDRGAQDAEPTFSMNKFLDELFPGKIGQIDYNKNNLVYSRRQRTKSLFKELFPGVEVKGSAVVRNGGTFQPVIENRLAKETRLVRGTVSKILKEMKKHHVKGFNGKDVIARSKHIWSNKEKWKQNQRPSAIYRSPYDGSEPTFLIRPEQIYGLLPLAEGDIDQNQSLGQAIDRMSQGVAFLKLQDHLFDIQTRAAEECYSEKNQGAVAQTNCEQILRRTKMSMEFLEHKMIAEERVIKIQREIDQMVEGVRIDRSGRFRSSPPTNEDLREQRKIPRPSIRRSSSGG